MKCSLYLPLVFALETERGVPLLCTMDHGFFILDATCQLYSKLLRVDSRIEGNNKLPDCAFLF